MKTSGSLLCVLVGTVLLGAVTPGCSLIGLAVDSSQLPDTLEVSARDQALRGKSLILLLCDGYSLYGECLRAGTLPDELYRSRFARWRQQAENTAFPFSPGDTILVTPECNQTAFGVLRGFGRTSVILRTFPTVRARFQPGARTEVLAYEKIDSLSRPGSPPVSRVTLQRWLDACHLPTMEGILLRRGDTGVWVAMDDVERVCEIRREYPWFNRGAFVDAAGLVAAIAYFAMAER